MLNAQYVSVWDGGVEVTSPCNYNPDTKTVSDIESVEIGGLDVLEDEYIIFNGEEIRTFYNDESEEWVGGTEE